MIMCKTLMSCSGSADQRQRAWAGGQSPARGEGAAGGVFTKQTQFAKTNPVSRPGPSWRAICPRGPGLGTDCLPGRIQAGVSPRFEPRRKRTPQTVGSNCFSRVGAKRGGPGFPGRSAVKPAKDPVQTQWQPVSCGSLLDGVLEHLCSKGSTQWPSTCRSLSWA